MAKYYDESSSTLENNYEELSSTLDNNYKNLSNLEKNYINVYKNYEIEKAKRMETEKIFQNMWTLSEQILKQKKVKLATHNNPELEILIEKNKELKEKANKSITKLNNANENIYRLKQLLILERRKEKDEINTEIKPTTQSEILKNRFSKVSNEEIKAKANALEKIKNLSKQLENMETEKNEIKKENREIKTKILDIIPIKNQLVVENEKLIAQRDKLLGKMNEKDEEIKKIVQNNMNVLENPLVLKNISWLKQKQQAEETKYKEEFEHYKKSLQEVRMNNVEQRNKLEEVDGNLIKVRQQHDQFKQAHDDLDNFEMNISNAENTVLEHIEATKQIKMELIRMKNINEKKEQDIANLKKELRIKCAELTVLSEVKKLNEKKLQCRCCCPKRGKKID